MMKYILLFFVFIGSIEPVEINSSLLQLIDNKQTSAEKFETTLLNFRSSLSIDNQTKNDLEILAALDNQNPIDAFCAYNDCILRQFHTALMASRINHTQEHTYQFMHGKITFKYAGKLPDKMIENMNIFFNDFTIPLDKKITSDTIHAVTQQLNALYQLMFPTKSQQDLKIWYHMASGMYYPLLILAKYHEEKKGTIDCSHMTDYLRHIIHSIKCISHHDYEITNITVNNIHINKDDYFTVVRNKKKYPIPANWIWFDLLFQEIRDTKHLKKSDLNLNCFSTK